MYNTTNLLEKVELSAVSIEVAFLVQVFLTDLLQLLE